jgi:hypothetical protein
MSTDRVKSAGPPDTARPTFAGAGDVAVRVTLGGEVVVAPDPDPWLTSAQCAERIGVKPGTWRTLVRDGYAPRADDPGDPASPANRRTHRWRTSSVDRFVANRPGQGKGPRRRRAIVPFSGELR